MAFFQGKTLWINQLDDGAADLRFGAAGETVSPYQPGLLSELNEALERVAAGSFRVLFVHLGRAARAALSLDLEILADVFRADEWRSLAEAGQQTARRLAELNVPSVAMISGACLGAELQLALACDYRVVIDKPSTQFGLPELELGLLPFWGVSHRLPRLIGLEQSIKFLLTGRRLRPAEALSWGLADAVTAEGDQEPPSFLESPSKQTRSWLPRQTWREWLVESLPPGRWLLFKGGQRLISRRFPEDMSNATLLLEALRQGLKKGPDEAERLEREALVQLSQQPVWRNLLNLHRQREAIRAAYLPDRRERIRQIGVMGIDGRGGALAVLAATHNCHVILQEKDELSLGLALMVLLNLFQQELGRGALNPAEMKKNLNNVKATTNFRDFKDLEILLLAGNEPLDSLAGTLRNVEDRVRNDTLIAGTDPAVPAETLAAMARHPERIACVHFQAPAGRSLLVEVVPSSGTSESDMRRLMEWIVQLGRTPRRVPDGPGFLFNRLLVPYLLEAILLAKEGIRTDRIDQAMASFGMVHGPLEHMDLMGLDVVHSLVQILQPTWGDRIPADDTVEPIVSRNWLGQKTEVGFYRYRKGRRKLHHRLMGELRESGRRQRPDHLEVLSVVDQKKKVMERLAFLWINEAARCLETGYINDARDLDLTLCLGGWAPHRGGPLAYARTLGRQKVTQTFAALETRHGERYRMSPWLKSWLPEPP